jgi:uncharacterized membrane protein YqjE
MEESTVSFTQLAASAKQFVRRLLTIGENRLELLTVEIQEGREQILCVCLLALGIMTFALLAGLTLTATIVVLLWPWSPVLVLLLLTLLYGAAGFYLYRRLTSLLRTRQTLSATLEQIKKDRECLEKLLA